MTSSAADEPKPPLRTIRFHLTLHDMQMLAARPRPLPQRIRVMLGGGWILACFIVGVMNEEIAPLLSWAGDYWVYIAVGGVTVLYYLLDMLVTKVLTQVRIRQARAPSTDTIIDFREDRIDVQLDGQASKFPWAQLAEVRLEAEGLTLYMTSGEGLYIPQRAFPDPQAMLDFNVQVDEFRHQMDDGK